MAGQDCSSRLDSDLAKRTALAGQARTTIRARPVFTGHWKRNSFSTEFDTVVFNATCIDPTRDYSSATR